MPRIDDVKESEAKKNNRLLRRTSRVTPGNNQSVTGGRTRFIGLKSLIVIGSQLVSGLLEVTGSIKILGLGILDVGGPAKFSATLDVTAETRLRGETTLESDMNVKDGGKITLEGVIPVILGKVGNFVGMFFGTGASIRGFTGGLAIVSPDGINSVTVTNSGVGLTNGAVGILVNDEETKISGAVYLLDLPTISGVSANVTVDPDTGQLGVV